MCFKIYTWWVVAEEEVGGGVVSAMKEKGSGSGSWGIGGTHTLTLQNVRTFLIHVAVRRKCSIILLQYSRECILNYTYATKSTKVQTLGALCMRGTAN